MSKKLKKYSDLIWQNPYTKRFCHVAYEGAGLARIEDIVQADEPRNTRLLSYDQLELELSFVKNENMRVVVNPKTIYGRRFLQTARHDNNVVHMPARA